jgi:hypothetical protein
MSVEFRTVSKEGEAATHFRDFNEVTQQLDPATGLFFIPTDAGWVLTSEHLPNGGLIHLQSLAQGADRFSAILATREQYEDPKFIQENPNYPILRRIVLVKEIGQNDFKPCGVLEGVKDSA